MSVAGERRGVSPPWSSRRAYPGAPGLACCHPLFVVTAVARLWVAAFAPVARWSIIGRRIIRVDSPPWIPPALTFGELGLGERVHTLVVVHPKATGRRIGLRIFLHGWIRGQNVSATGLSTTCRTVRGATIDAGV